MPPPLFGVASIDTSGRLTQPPQGCVKVRLAAFAKIYVCDNVAELE